MTTVIEQVILVLNSSPFTVDFAEKLCPGGRAELGPITTRFLASLRKLASFIAVPRFKSGAFTYLLMKNLALILGTGKSSLTALSDRVRSRQRQSYVAKVFRLHSRIWIESTISG